MCTKLIAIPSVFHNRDTQKIYPIIKQCRVETHCKPWLGRTLSEAETNTLFSYCQSGVGNIGV